MKGFGREERGKEEKGPVCREGACGSAQRLGEGAAPERIRSEVEETYSTSLRCGSVGSLVFDPTSGIGSGIITPKPDGAAGVFVSATLNLRLNHDRADDGGYGHEKGDGEVEREHCRWYQGVLLKLARLIRSDGVE